jgi:hypothetical protein
MLDDEACLGASMKSELEAQAKKYLSDIRLFRYLDFVDPLEVYFNNLIISEKLLGMISVFEVVFRNKINIVLKDEFGDNYLTNSNLHVFNPKEKRIIQGAIKKACKTGVKIKESRILSELTIGFWCRLIEKHSLWIKCLHKIHLNRQSVKFKMFVKKVRLIADVRNKVAHHERIIKKRPYNIKNILNTITDETLLLIDDSDNNFKQHIKQYTNSVSVDIQFIISKSQKKRGHV